MSGRETRIALESPDQPAVIALIAELDAYQQSLYPPESNHLLDLSALCRPEVLFAVARSDDGQVIGCGAVVLAADHGEVKRMFVSPRARGQGLAKALLRHLEGEARARGCRALMLETGIHQHEALALYERDGYQRRGPFGGYAEDPLSVFMAKPLDG